MGKKQDNILIKTMKDTKIDEVFGGPEINFGTKQPWNCI